MSTLVRVTSDGRLYPPTWPHMPPAERERLRGLEHHLRCAEGLSIRQVQRAMLSRFGERRSTGQIHRDLQQFECPRCSTAPKPPPPPDPRQKAQVFEWR
jgi:hypothetical protein